MRLAREVEESVLSNEDCPVYYDPETDDILLTKSYKELGFSILSYNICKEFPISEDGPKISKEEFIRKLKEAYADYLRTHRISFQATDFFCGRKIEENKVS
jgi:hypothetical protein